MGDRPSTAPSTPYDDEIAAMEKDQYEKHFRGSRNDALFILREIRDAYRLGFEDGYQMREKESAST